MRRIDTFKIEKVCNYKDETYYVRDNGAIMRIAKVAGRKRPLDNQWTFGKVDVEHGYMVAFSNPVHRIVATAFHGNPPTSSIQVINPKTGQEIIKWDLKDSMSYFVKPDDNCGLKIKTKVFDPLRDYNLTIMCSNLIHNMVFLRRIYLNMDSDKGKLEEFPVYLFEKDFIKAHTKMNVSSQNHVFKIHKS